MQLSSENRPNYARWEWSSDTFEPLSIPWSDPTVIGNWVSPVWIITDENADFVKDFNYTTNAGAITYVWERDVVVDVLISCSLASDTNNVISKLQWVKNWIPSSSSYLTRKIATAGDVGNVTVPWRFALSKWDYIDFFLWASSVCILTVQHTKINISTVVVV